MGLLKDKKPAPDNIINCISSIFDPQDMEVIVVRGKNCEIIFANEKAKARIEEGSRADYRCKSGFSKGLSALCACCPHKRKNSGADKLDFIDIEDHEGGSYGANCTPITWVDGRPATLIVLRDTTREKEIRDRLHSLAYIDQLTGIPNRQKLKEDFAALEDKIAANKLSGIIAMFDMDRFKQINDTYGHNTGDVVLRRLTEHLQGDKSFNGHLYRLGGDEFVFFYAARSSKFDSDEKLIQYYQNLLSPALRSYTLPNIEMFCTMSIGVSIFPKHGDNLSEVLRKADIALYQAKEKGRNQMIFFEDRYEVAQRFKDLYINIQPVLYGSGKTFGYELIDRGNTGEDDDNTVNLSEFNRALDSLGFSDINNDMLYFISYSKQLLNPAVMGNLPKNKFIILLNLPEQLTKDDIKRYADLTRRGYKLALVNLNSAKATHELLSIASYCKFTVGEPDIALQKKIIASNPNILFIAAKVDSTDVFVKAKDAGFHLYQGYFFNQPVETRKTKEIGPLKVNYFRLLKLCSTEGDMDFREISEIIAADVALTYKLLRILTSAAVGLRKVSSIKMAVAYLGEESLKKWIALLALRGMTDDQPMELVRMSLIRARFGEILAPHFRIKRSPKKLFMVGLLSLLHIALEQSREELLNELPVSEDIRESLLFKTGAFSDMLRFYEHFEYANWENVTQFAEEHHLDPQFVNDAYIAAVKWYNDLTKV